LEPSLVREKTGLVDKVVRNTGVSSLELSTPRCWVQQAVQGCKAPWLIGCKSFQFTQYVSPSALEAGALDSCNRRTQKQPFI